MPEYKLQHYVPRCHLRPFSVDGNGNAIALYNISSDKFVAHAPLRNQCAKDYFYRHGNELERVLQPIEGKYASVVKFFLESTERQNVDHLEFLRNFALLQSLRTEMAAKRKSIMNSVLYDLFKEYDPNSVTEYDLSEQSILAASLSSLEHLQHSLRDLRCILIVNRSSLDFVTSDDPAVFTNRLHLQKLKKQDFGFQNSGAILMLPLSSRLAFACFDPHVYVVTALNGSHIVLRNAVDIEAVNQFQFMRAGANIYFRDWSSRERVKQSFLVASTSRRENWGVVRYARKVKSDNSAHTFVEATEVEARNSEHSLLHFQAQFPEPLCWPKFITWHPKPRIVDSKSAAGLLRPLFG